MGARGFLRNCLNGPSNALKTSPLARAIPVSVSAVPSCCGEDIAMKTKMAAGHFEVKFYGGGYVDAVKSSLDGDVTLTQDRSEVQHLGAGWDAIWVILSNKEMMQAALGGAVLFGGSIAAGVLGEVGKDLYAKAKKLLVGCQAAHREKCISALKQASDIEVPDLERGIHIFYAVPREMGGLQISFRTNSFDGEGKITTKEIDDQRIATMMKAFEMVIAPKILAILDRFPDADIRMELRTDDSNLPAGGSLTVDRRGNLAALEIGPSYSFEPFESGSEDLHLFLHSLTQKT